MRARPRAVQACSVDETCACPIDVTCTCTIDRLAHAPLTRPAHAPLTRPAHARARACREVVHPDHWLQREEVGQDGRQAQGHCQVVQLALLTCALAHKACMGHHAALRAANSTSFLFCRRWHKHRGAHEFCCTRGVSHIGWSRALGRRSTHSRGHHACALHLPACSPLLPFYLPTDGTDHNVHNIIAVTVNT
eukprot:364726-Chlamydomonas_euryale.AAC.11